MWHVVPYPAVGLELVGDDAAEAARVQACQPLHPLQLVVQQLALQQGQEVLRTVRRPKADGQMVKAKGAPAQARVQRCGRQWGARACAHGRPRPHLRRGARHQDALLQLLARARGRAVALALLVSRVRLLLVLLVLMLGVREALVHVRRQPVHHQRRLLHRLAQPGVMACVRAGSRSCGNSSLEAWACGAAGLGPGRACKRASGGGGPSTHPARCRWRPQPLERQQMT